MNYANEIVLKTWKIDCLCSNEDEIAKYFMILYKTNNDFRVSIDLIICKFNSTRKWSISVKDIFRVYDYEKRIKEDRSLEIKKVLLVKEFFEVMLDDYNIRIFLNNFECWTTKENLSKSTKNSVLRIMTWANVDIEWNGLFGFSIRSYLQRIKYNIEIILKENIYDLEWLEKYLSKRISVASKWKHKNILTTFMMNLDKILTEEDIWNIGRIYSKPELTLYYIFNKYIWIVDQEQWKQIIEDIKSVFNLKSWFSKQLQKLVIKIILLKHDKLRLFKILSYINIPYESFNSDKLSDTTWVPITHFSWSWVPLVKIDQQSINKQSDFWDYRLKLGKILTHYGISINSFDLDSFKRFLVENPNIKLKHSHIDTSEISLLDEWWEALLQRTTQTETKMNFSSISMEQILSTLSITELENLFLLYFNSLSK